MKSLSCAWRIVCVLLFSGIGCCQDLSDGQIANRVEAYLKPFVETGNLTGTVLIARKGRVLFRHSYGMANYELRVPNSPETRFHIASISKAFTAAAILQLQEQGRLSVADPLSRFVPDFPNGDRITLDNLLTHTSGIPDINDLSDYDTFARSPHTIAQLVAKFANLPLEFQPGSSYQYSNSNYNLLALVLEKVTGESYGGYLRKHILDPLGMQDSGHDGDASQLIPLAASGYKPAGIADYEKAPYLDWSTKTGNGSLYSTVDDLYRFDRTLNTDALLKSATRQKYFVEGSGNRYGWYIGKRIGHRVMSGKGRSPGFGAELDRFPDDDVTIILLSNSYSTVSQDPIAAGLGAIVFGQQPSPPTMHATAMPQPTLASCAGTYQYGPEYFAPNAKFTLTAEPGYLLLELGDLRTPVVPVAENDFLERNFFGHVVMSKDAGGAVNGLTTRYGQKEFTARRLEAK
ncbi:MAG TPA: serine hydrolase domain-containing protein [Candidatus Sulfotelmatobacter sp.]|jgi:CubicO group peptidase (beta-lactamase class C family)|nr:serine hydrolase domain-containing protein [Candidatus Sulfotelmatobacter sp.]